MVKERIGEIRGMCYFRASNWFYGLASGSNIDARVINMNDNRTEVVFEVEGKRHVVRAVG